MTNAQETGPVERIVRLHHMLKAGNIPHAFGGALALAWCTQRARGTIDIDVNLFVSHLQADEVLKLLSPHIEVSDAHRRAIAVDGQTRLWWDQTPVDLFFNTTDFHEQVATRTRTERFGGHNIPFLACGDLAVFKTFFDRPQDWVDLGQMAEAGTLDVESVVAEIRHHLGVDDPRVQRLRQLA